MKWIFGTYIRWVNKKKVSHAPHLTKTLSVTMCNSCVSIVITLIFYLKISDKRNKYHQSKIFQWYLWFNHLSFRNEGPFYVLI